MDDRHDGSERAARLAGRSSLLFLRLRDRGGGDEAFVRFAATHAASDGLNRAVGGEQEANEQDNHDS
jgi:hypothetical protein